MMTEAVADAVSKGDFGGMQFTVNGQQVSADEVRLFFDKLRSRVQQVSGARRRGGGGVRGHRTEEL